MLYMQDFIDDLESGNTIRIEPWFRALVLFPIEDEIAEVPSDPGDLTNMLRAAAGALKDDESFMPRDLYDHLAELLDPVADLSAGTRYRDVALHVTNHAGRFFATDC